MTRNTPVTEFYGRWSRVYDLISRQFPGITASRNQAIRALSLVDGDVVLEMGCGTGANFPYLLENVGPTGQVIGVDVTREMLDVAQRRIRRKQWNNVNIVLSDATQLPTAEVVNGILGTFVTGMFENPDDVIDHWCTMLEPGGKLVLLDAQRSSFPLARFFNPLFRACVTLSTPPTTQIRYNVSPSTVLQNRENEARDALIARSSTHWDEELLFGFLRLTCGTIK